ncbi:MAG: transcriptional initiation protein Tat [Armatimonadetes bacterium]|nr:transcriptional initiation protein Tat [Armatimonadota bacterium]
MNCCYLVAAALCLLAAAGSAHAKAYCVPVPPTDRGNDHYVGNRPPLAPSPFMKLPVGAIRPEGWLRTQLELEANGMTGHLTEISPWCEKDGNAWLAADGEGKNGWEELPYWLKGFGDLGYVLGDERIEAEARVWIEGMLSSREADGWFGPRDNKRNNDLWPNMIALNCLQSYCEHTGDERVIALMTAYFRWQLAMPEEQMLPGSWQKIRAGDNLESVYWLYNRTGEPWLIDLAHKIHRRTADWTNGFPTWHGVNICQGFRQPAEYYVLSRDPQHLEGTERRYAEVMQLYGQQPGGMFGADENAREGYRDPRQAAESCSMVEFMHSYQMLLTMLGDVTYADRCEDVALNSFPTAQPPDQKGLHYLTAPNMPQLDKDNKSPGLQNGGCMLAYDPHSYRCCQHNVSHGWPYYAEHLWLATPGNGLAAVLYARSSVTAKVGDGTEVTITEETDYPFSPLVSLTVSAPQRVAFPLCLRIPGWCSRARAEVNGRALDAKPRPGEYLVIEREWSDGDTVELTLLWELDIKPWAECGGAVSVHLGPLAYSLKIGERWERYGGTDEWPAYEVLPTTPWNYGLILPPVGTLEWGMANKPLADQPFTPENAPVEVHVQGKRIPNWQLEKGLCPTLQPSPIKSAERVEELTLIPMGCARLRISAFPVIGDGPDAHEWQAPPPPRHVASHCWGNDTEDACSDGRLPQSSNDQSIPRFTWWDHRGTEEWITWRFDRPRTVSECEVYWFDDTGVGQCRVPVSWRLLYRDGEEWKPVTGAGDFGVARDAFNRVTFEPVTTTEVEIVVKLQAEWSGGILEWRLGPLD